MEGWTSRQTDKWMEFLRHVLQGMPIGIESTPQKIDTVEPRNNGSVYKGEPDITVKSFSPSDTLVYEF